MPDFSFGIKKKKKSTTVDLTTWNKQYSLLFRCACCKIHEDKPIVLTQSNWCLTDKKTTERDRELELA